MRIASRQGGSALIVVLFVIAALTLIGLAVLGSTTLSLRSTDATRDDAELFYIAEAGMERMVADITCALAGAPPIGALFDNFVNLHLTHGRSRGSDTVAGTADDRGRDYVNMPFGRGSYTIDIITNPTTAAEAVQLEYVDLMIRSTGTLDNQTKTLQSTVRLKLSPSPVFDYAYFSNNFDWVSGRQCGELYVHGNMRSSTKLDLFTSCVRGGASPQYQRVIGDDLINKLNGGGLFAGTIITRANAAQDDFSPLAVPLNRYENLGPMPFPNLNELSLYVSAARTWNGGTAGADGVWGTRANCSNDDTGGATLQAWDQRLNAGAGGYRTYRGCIGCDGYFCKSRNESPYMILDGSRFPIIVDGPVVIGWPGPDGVWNTQDEWDGTPRVRNISGAVIVRGRVKGKGAIISAGNIYLPSAVTYDVPTTPHLPGPTTGNPGPCSSVPCAGDGYTYSGAPVAMPTAHPTMTEAAVEGWRQFDSTHPTPNPPSVPVHNVKDADMVGFYARGGIMLANFCYPTAGYGELLYNVFNARNSIKEDWGDDKTPNTGDAGEGDGTWHVLYYGVQQCGSGLTPAGVGVGSVIPGSGEDIDGDGTYDGFLQIGNIGIYGVESDATASEFAFPEPFNDRLNTNLTTLIEQDGTGDNRFWGGSTLVFNPTSPFAPLNDLWAYGIRERQAGIKVAENSVSITSLSGVFYANRWALGVYRIGADFGYSEIFGALVSRVNGLWQPQNSQGLILPVPPAGTPITIYTHDPRLIGGGPPALFLPRVLSLEIRSWNQEFVK